MHRDPQTGERLCGRAPFGTLRSLRAADQQSGQAVAAEFPYLIAVVVKVLLANESAQFERVVGGVDQTVQARPPSGRLSCRCAVVVMIFVGHVRSVPTSVTEAVV